MTDAPDILDPFEGIEQWAEDDDTERRDVSGKAEVKEMARYIVWLHNAALKTKKEGGNGAEA